MNRQTIFDTVVAHLLTQNERSERDGQCKYRLKKRDGRILKCAVGCLIPDEVYVPKMDNNEGPTSIEAIFSKYDLPHWMGGRNLSFLQALQDIHDIESVDSWEKILRVFAHDWKLKYNEPRRI